VTDQAIFQITFIKSISHKGSYMFFDSVSRFFVEVSNNYTNVILSGCEILNFVRNQSASQPALMHQIEHIPFGTHSLINFRPEVKTMCNRICRFYQMLNDKSLEKQTLLTEDDWKNETELLESNPEQAATKSNSGSSHAQIIVLLQQMFSIPEEGNPIRDVSNGTFSQLISFIKICYEQIKSMDLQPSLNPLSYTEIQYRPVLTQLKVVRLLLGNKILEISNKYVWANAQSTRNETAEMKLIKDEVLKSMTRSLEAYRSRMQNIPQWDAEKKFTIIFFPQAMKLIYHDPAQVPDGLRNFIKLASFSSNTDPYPSLLKMKQKELLTLLTEAFNINNTEEFRRSRDLGEESRNQSVEQILEKSMDAFGNGDKFILDSDLYMKFMLI